MSFDVDLFVIGGGSGGVRAARMAAKAGARVALAEEYRMGGTCVIRGCVPKKLMVYASEFRDMPQAARAFGWEIPDGRFHWARFRKSMHAELNRLEAIYERMLDTSGVTVYPSRAVITGPQEITLADGHKITAKDILIAVGGQPMRLDIPGAELAETSDDIFQWETLPAKLLIIGGGYIATEFACILNGLGVDVTQFYRGEKILRGFDIGCSDHIAEAIMADGVRLRTGVNAVSLQSSGDQIEVETTRGTRETFDKVVFATGRIAKTHGLGLDDVGIEQAENGSVLVDRFSCTNVPSIWAVGDVTDRVQLTPVAIREAMAFVDTLYHNRPTEPDHTLIPSAVFTQPEMGSVGLSEEAAAKVGPIEVYETRFKPMQNGFAGSDRRVLMKLIVNPKTRVVVGCHIVAPSAGEMIQLAGIAVKMGATKEQFDQTCAVHPTMSEELVTMREPTRTLG